MQAPTVLKRGSYTAIAVMSLTERVSIIEMSEGPLKIRTTNHADLATEGWAPYEYPVAKAVERYLAHSGGLTNDARRALEKLATPSSVVEQPVKETQAMSIENILERLAAAQERTADALEKLVDVNTGRNLILEASGNVSTSPEAAAAEAIEKAATKGRRTKKAEDPAPAAAAEPAATEPAAESATAAAEPAATQPADPAPAQESAPPAATAKLEDVQKLAASLAAKHREAVLAAISSFGKTKISELDAAVLPELFKKLKAIESPAAEESFL